MKKSITFTICLMIACAATSQTTSTNQPPDSVCFTQAEAQKIAIKITEADLCAQELQIKQSLILAQQHKIDVLVPRNQYLANHNIALVKQLNEANQTVHNAKRSRILYIAGGVLGGALAYAILF